ncbi:MAG: hypothetical protein RL215_1466, partial [Planctomycetota bacterium]
MVGLDPLSEGYELVCGEGGIVVDESDADDFDEWCGIRDGFCGGAGAIEESFAVGWVLGSGFSFGELSEGEDERGAAVGPFGISGIAVEFDGGVTGELCDFPCEGIGLHLGIPCAASDAHGGEAADFDGSGAIIEYGGEGFQGGGFGSADSAAGFTNFEEGFEEDELVGGFGAFAIELGGDGIADAELFGFDEIAVAEDVSEGAGGDGFYGVGLVIGGEDIEECGESVGVDFGEGAALDGTNFVKEFDGGDGGNASIEAIGEEWSEGGECIGAEFFSGGELVGGVTDVVAAALDVGFEFFEELLGIGGAGDEVGFGGAEEGVVEVVLDDFCIRGGVVAICEESEV